jgi:hypothetical protein
VWSVSRLPWPGMIWSIIVMGTNIAGLSPQTALRKPAAETPMIRNGWLFS